MSSAAAPPEPLTLAVVDVGSNSLHFQLVRGERTLALERAAIQLGRMEAGRLRPETIAQAAEAIAGWARDAEQLGARFEVSATAAVREALNGEELRAALHPIPLRVLSGEEEARMAWLGARKGLGLEGRALVFDLGGRSTEFALGEGERLLALHSLPFGHLSLEGPAEEVRRTVRRLLAPVAGLRAPVVGTAGTACTLAYMAALARGESTRDRHGLSLGRAELEALLARLERGEGPRLPGFDERRADTLWRGGLAVLEILDTLEAPGLVSSLSALREGLVEDLRLRCSSPLP